MNSNLSSLLVLLAVSAAVTAEKASCRAARKCCDGKDADCVVPATSPNDIVSGMIMNDDYDDDYEALEPCYCDHGCLDVGDCCPDFKDYCGVIDCSVGEWSEWSSCDVSCGIGTSVRSREVLRPESNGGVQCPPLEEKRTCEQHKCSRRHLRRISAVKETAMLLPGKYARRNFNKYDVRSNLRSFRRKEDQFHYCAVFRVDKSMGSCQKSRDTSQLKKGNTVCVWCDAKSQRDNLGDRCQGHGAENRKTKFKNLMNPRCHGKWTRLHIADECPCGGDKPDFVFV